MSCMAGYKRNRVVVITDPDLDERVDALCKKQNRPFSNLVKTLLMKELENDIGRPAPTYKIPATIARAAGALASVYYRLLRYKLVFTTYSMDVCECSVPFSFTVNV